MLARINCTLFQKEKSVSESILTSLKKFTNTVAYFIADLLPSLSPNDFSRAKVLSADPVSLHMHVENSH